MGIASDQWRRVNVAAPDPPLAPCRSLGEYVETLGLNLSTSVDAAVCYTGVAQDFSLALAVPEGYRTLVMLPELDLFVWSCEQEHAVITYCAGELHVVTFADRETFAQECLAVRAFYQQLDGLD